MPSNGKRNRGRQPYINGKRTPFQPGDEVVGEYSRERLIKMNDRFVARVESAFKTGKENRQSAAAMNGANASRLH